MANTQNTVPKWVLSANVLTCSKQDLINSDTNRMLSIILRYNCKEPEVVTSFRTKNLSKEYYCKVIR